MAMSSKADSLREFFFLDKVDIKSEMDFRQNKLQKKTRDKMEFQTVCPHLEAFVDFYSFFLLIPFRVKFDQETSQYKIYSSRCRKVNTSKKIPFVIE